MTGIVAFQRRMTADEYERERAMLRATYGDSSAEASAKRDQALALLFARSNWTQEDLAKKESEITGKNVSRPYIAQRLLFGRFVNFVAMATIPENRAFDASAVIQSFEGKLELLNAKNLTERKFRSYWCRTSGTNERQRFVEVQKLMAEDLVLRQQKRSPIGHDILAAFGDGKWHAVETIAKELGMTVDHVQSTLRTMQALGTYGAKCEPKQVGKTFHYRIFKKARMISSNELIAKLGPIIDRLTTEGKKSTVTMSPPTVAGLAGELRKLIEEWTG